MVLPSDAITGPLYQYFLLRYDANDVVYFLKAELKTIDQLID